MTEQWQELKETITELRDNDGTGTQQEVCKFLVNYMEVLEKQMQEPVLDKIRVEVERKIVKRPWLDFKDRERDRNDAFLEVLDIIDKYKADIRGEEV